MKLHGFSLFIAMCMAMTPLSVRAQDGLWGAEARLTANEVFPHRLFDQRLVAADFDNDHKPDGAVLISVARTDGHKTFRIEFHTTAHENTEVIFGSNESELTISVLDVNRDGAPDIVLRQAVTQKVLQVWMNDGRGAFREARREELGLVPDESPCQLSSYSQVQDCPAFSLPSKSGSDSARPTGDNVSLAFPERSRKLRLQFERADPLCVVPISGRGPPRFFSL